VKLRDFKLSNLSGSVDINFTSTVAADKLFIFVFISIWYEYLFTHYSIWSLSCWSYLSTFKVGETLLCDYTVGGVEKQTRQMANQQICPMKITSFSIRTFLNWCGSPSCASFHNWYTIYISWRYSYYRIV